MDKYKLLQRLGKGGQGSVFLVKSKFDNSDYVLKKIECNDEVEANRAFKEVLALKELQNAYICGYRDFFVMWDKQESAMFVCIIMVYYEMGDLGKLLSQKKKEMKCIEEQMIKKWLGQLLIALEFVHKNKMIHRDLKPSNLFLTEELDIRIGDFGVATIMADMHTHTQTAVGSTYWMAPEVTDRNYDERSDVWSMGCIILEMASCGIYDSDEIWKLLLGIKNETDKLDDAIVKLQKKHSEGLCDFIKKALTIDSKRRPFINQLIEDPYANECIVLLQSLSPNENKETLESPPIEKGTEDVLNYIKEYKDNKEQLIIGMDSISDMIKSGNGKPLTVGGHESIINLLHENQASMEVLLSGFNMLSISLSVQAFKDRIELHKLITVIIKGMQVYKSSEDYQLIATKLLMILSTDEILALLIGELGGVQDIIEAFKTFSGNTQISINCCRAVWSLSINERNSKIISHEKGASLICNAIKMHFHDAYLVEVGLAALWCLSIEDENIKIMVREKALDIILKSIQQHKDSAIVLKNALMTLASLVEADESSAYELMTDDDHHHQVSNGMDIIINSIKFHQCNEDVMDTYCSLITELAFYDDLRYDLKSKQINQMLSEIKTQFPANEELTRSIDDAIDALDNVTVIKRCGSE